MAWRVYSPEDFPKAGHQEEFLQAFGYRLQDVKAGKWHKLPEMYVEQRWTDWQHAADKGDPKETTVTSKQLALKIQFNFNRHPVYGDRGIRAYDYDNSGVEDRRKVELEAEAANKKFRKNVIREFEIQYREKLRGEGGYLTPTAYQEDCYRTLGIKVPDLVQPDQPPIQVIAPPALDPALMEKMFETWAEKRGLTKIANELGTPAG